MKPPRALPHNKTLLAAHLRAAIDAAWGHRRLTHDIDWARAAMYLRGVRMFRYDPETNTLQMMSQAKERFLGRHFFRDHGALKRKIVEAGRLERLNILPAAKIRGMGLGALRDRSMAHVVLRSHVENLPLDEIKAAHIDVLLTYGTAGLACWEQDLAKAGPMPVLEVIRPKDLFTIPAQVEGPDDIEYLVRDRWVPIEFARNMEKVKLPRSNSQMGLMSIPAGARLDSTPTPGPASIEYLHPYEKASTKGGEIQAVRLQEIWQADLRNAVTRYIVMLGDAVVLDERYDPEKSAEATYMPIHVARYATVQESFYGLGQTQMLIDLATEGEKMQANIYRQVQEWDALGPTFVPSSWGLTDADFIGNARGGIHWYDERPGQRGSDHIFNLNPPQTSDYTGKVLAMVEGRLDKLAGHSEMFAGGVPGRIESTPALRTLHEIMSVTLVPTSQSIANCWAGVYGAMLNRLRARWKSVADTIEAFAIDDAAMGLQIDRQTGRFQLKGHSLPGPFDVKIDIEDRNPQSAQERILSLNESFDRGLIDPIDYMIANWRYQLGLVVGHWPEEQQWRRGMLNNLLLFNDGETPGMAVTSSVADIPTIQIRVLQQFMARPEFALASRQVRQAFEDRADHLRVGKPAPPQLAYPEDLAAEQAAMTAGAAPQAMLGAGSETEPTAALQGVPA